VQSHAALEAVAIDMVWAGDCSVRVAKTRLFHRVHTGRRLHEPRCMRRSVAVAACVIAPQRSE
jgi:hypothetical protein